MKFFVMTVLFAAGMLFGCASQPTGPSPPLDSHIVQRANPTLLASAEPVSDGLIGQTSDQEPDQDPEQDPDQNLEPSLDDEELFLDDELDDFDSDEDVYSVADPLEPFNRAMFYFNDKLYFWAFKPVATGYRAVTPQTMRIGIRNFFVNLLGPVRIVNNVLQGNGQSAEAEFAKFIYNSTAGVLGFGNPAKKYPAMNPDPEDLGQTMGKYGIGDGFYIVWPVLGSSTLRDTIGDLGDGFLNPVSYVDPLEAYLTVRAVNTINSLSFYLGDYETLKKAALDPYESMRNAYIQMRQSKIRQ